MLNDKPVVCPSICLVADLLGMKKKIGDCCSPAESNDLCQNLYDCLKDFKSNIQDDVYPNPWSYTMFSDTIVLGYPVEPAGGFGESELGFTVDFVQQFQMYMTLNGYLVRGGLSFGELHISNEHCFGKALVHAYELEKEKNKANVPRIIISEAVKNLLEQHLRFYSDPGQAPQATDFLIDAEDGFVFVNYLSSFLGEFTDMKALKAHKDTVLDLYENADNEDVKEKIEWTMAYHDFFCDDQIVGTEEYWPSKKEIEDMKFNGSRDVSSRFNRLARRSSNDITTKTRFVQQLGWPSLDEC